MEIKATMHKVFATMLAALLAIVPMMARAGQEADIGAQFYQQLAAQHKLVLQSPYYTILNPIAQRISAVATPQYNHPFRFILVNDKTPNAFSVPGGNVYVDTGLMTFVQNREELAGVLCHETSHTIHHDVMNLNRKAQGVNLAANVLSLLIGGGHNQIANTILGMGAQLQDAHFSRNVEEAADLKGAHTCASAGYNPWGMVWLFQNFAKSDTGGGAEFLSDHPNNVHRIQRLEQLFASEPSTFRRFSPNIASAKPLSRV